MAHCEQIHFEDEMFQIVINTFSKSEIWDMERAQRSLHEAIEIKYFVEGTTTLLIGAKTVVAKPGDIVVMNHLDMTGGHTFIYMENILAYTDPGADSDATGIVQHVKVEASSTRGHTTQGDHRKNGTGAYWEVWVHAYASLWYGYDINDPNDHIRICRWPGGLEGMNILLLKRIRDGQYNLDEWTNKYNNIGL